MVPTKDANYYDAMAGQKVAAARPSRASVVGGMVRAISKEPNLRRLSSSGFVVLLLCVASPALAERRLQGLDLDLVIGGGPPFNLGGGVGVDYRPHDRLQLAASAMVGASTSVQADGFHSDAPATISGQAMLRYNLALWKSRHEFKICDTLLGNGLCLAHKAESRRTNALAVEAGVYLYALPFSWWTVTPTGSGTQLSERARDSRYVTYPAIGVRWDSFDADSASEGGVDRWTVGLRLYRGPLLAPSAPSGEVLAWGTSKDPSDPGRFEGASWGGSLFCNFVLVKYFAMGAELGGGALPSPPVFIRAWAGVSIPIL